MEYLDPGVEDVLSFWLEAGPELWYKADDAFDTEVSERFCGMWDVAAAGAYDRPWSESARGGLALIVLLDQFPRNMFRGQARAFHSDARALQVAHEVIDRGFDMEISTPERQFVYMPFMHSERLNEQDTCVELFSERMPGDNLRHARVHREIIRRFGRFPYRNHALGRTSNAEEEAFLEHGGYGKLLNDLS